MSAENALLSPVAGQPRECFYKQKVTFQASNMKPKFIKILRFNLAKGKTNTVLGEFTETIKTHTLFTVNYSSSQELDDSCVLSILETDLDSDVHSIPERRDYCSRGKQRY